MSDAADRERLQELLMKAVDGLVTADEERDLEELLERFPEQREELDDFRAIKETTDAMTARILADARLEPIREGPATRAALGLGLGLLLAGAAVLLGFAGWTLFHEPDVPLAIKVGAAALGAGLIVLLLIVLRRRARGKDPYEEVDL